MCAAKADKSAAAAATTVAAAAAAAAAAATARFELSADFALQFGNTSFLSRHSVIAFKICRC